MRIRTRSRQLPLGPRGPTFSPDGQTPCTVAGPLPARSDGTSAERCHHGLPGVRGLAAALVHWVGYPWQGRATQTYASILVANALWLYQTDRWIKDAALRSASTNLEQLSRDPLTSLLTSALWTDVDGWRSVLAPAAAVLLVFAPLERRIGTWRWILAFAAGHVGATLIVQGGLAVAGRAGLLDAAVSQSVDVGWSYGGMALLAVLTYLLPTRRRLPFATLVVAAQLLALRHPTFTDFGHLAAVIIGLALGPWLTRPPHGMNEDPARSTRLPERRPVETPAAAESS